MSFPNTHPVYTQGSVSTIDQAESKIRECFTIFGEDKFVDFVGLEYKGLGDLPELQKRFPKYIIKEHSWGHSIRPKHSS